MKKDTALAAVQEGDPKPVMPWFLSFGKYVFVPLCAACFILVLCSAALANKICKFHKNHRNQMIPVIFMEILSNYHSKAKKNRPF